MRPITLRVLLSLCLVNVPVTAGAEPIERQVEEVVARLIGAMDTSQQALARPGAPDVRITTCRVRLISSSTRSTGVILYQEQALTRDLASPYRQRFLRVAPAADGSGVESGTFKPAKPETLTGLCSRPEAARTVDFDASRPLECSVILKPTGKDYVGSTPEGGCPASFRGAVRIANTVVLQPEGMETWDRGFDAVGKQVWGAKEEPYRFRRIDPRPVGQ